MREYCEHDPTFTRNNRQHFNHIDKETIMVINLVDTTCETKKQR